MTWTAERTWVNQKVQIGAEATSTLGTPVAAGKLLGCFDWTMGIEADVSMYTATGHKYAMEQEENTEWSSGQITGDLDYNGVIYPLGGVMGAVSPVAHLASATAKDWIFTPPILGSIVPQTYTVQQGDSTRAQQIAYCLFNNFGYTLTRKKVDVTGKFMAQAISDGISLTSSPAEIALAPTVPKHFNVYLDATSGGLGTTQLLKVLQVQYSFDNVYGPFWPLNRSNTSWTSHIDLLPKPTVKMIMEADAAGMALLGYLQSGTTYYLQIDGKGTTAIATDGPGNIYNEFKHNMAIKLNKPANQFKNEQGIYAIEWEMEVVEDPNWNGGQAQQITVTNLMTAL